MNISNFGLALPGLRVEEMIVPRHTSPTNEKILSKPFP